MVRPVDGTAVSRGLKYNTTYPIITISICTGYDFSPAILSIVEIYQHQPRLSRELFFTGAFNIRTYCIWRDDSSCFVGPHGQQMRGVINVNPFRTPVPFGGHTTQIPSHLPPIVPKTRLRS